MKTAAILAILVALASPAFAQDEKQDGKRDCRLIRDSWRALLENYGFSVDEAESPEIALDLLKNNQYQLILADIIYENSEISGDTMLIQNPDLFMYSNVIAISGYSEDTIKGINKLRELGIKFLKKGGSSDEIIERVNQKLEERKRQMEKSAREFVVNQLENETMNDEPSSKSSSYSASNHLLKSLEQILIDSFKNRTKKDDKTIFYAGKQLSPNDLIKEIEEGTKIGQEHLEIMIDLFKESLNIRN